MDSQLRCFLFYLSLITSLFFSLSASSFAASSAFYKGDDGITTAPTKELYDGLYVGFGVGYDSYRLHTNINASSNGDTVTGNPVLNSNGFVSGIFAGFGQDVNRYLYFGGEALVDFSGASSNSTINDALATTTYNAKYNVNTSFGFSILPGFRLNPSSLWFFRLGLTYVNILLSENITSAGVGAGDNPQTWIHGIQYGTGIETVIYKNFSLRGEYIYSNYNFSSYSPLGTNYAPINNQFMLSLVYHV